MVPYRFRVHTRFHKPRFPVVCACRPALWRTGARTGMALCPSRCSDSDGEKVSRYVGKTQPVGNRAPEDRPHDSGPTVSPGQVDALFEFLHVTVPTMDCGCISRGIQRSYVHNTLILMVIKKIPPPRVFILCFKKLNLTAQSKYQLKLQSSVIPDLEYALSPGGIGVVFASYPIHAIGR